MERNLLGHHHPDAIDKGIQHVEHAARPMNDIHQPPCRGDAPMREGPHDAGPRAPVHVAPGRSMPEHRPPGLLRDNGPLNPDPHPYNPSSSVKLPNTYGNVPVEKRR
jgi:hypothetical protein